MAVINDFIAFINAIPLSAKVVLFAAVVVVSLMHYIFIAGKRYLFLVLLSGFLLALAFALIDPYLHIWDERFHALVAKNAAGDLLSPHLLNEVVFPYNYEVWVGNYIWLHKPPLALWEIALSIKLFGQHVLAVRFPSVIAFSATCYFVFQIAKRLFDRSIGYYAALVYVFYQYGLEQVSGIHTADHIDVSFTLYITASLWAWIAYQQDQKTKYVLLIGVFSGLAVLTKWMVGFLVFGIWGSYLLWLLFVNRVAIGGQLVKFLKSLGVALLVCMPWNVCAAINYPKEYWYEFNHARRHFSDVIEDHGGDILFYWENLSTLYGAGTLIPWVVLLSIVFTVVFLRETTKRIFVGAAILVIYTFFSLAATKMSNFVSVISPLVLICVTVFIYQIIAWINVKAKLSRYWSFLLLPLLFVFFLRPKETIHNHKLSGSFLRDYNIEVAQAIKALTVPENSVCYYHEFHNYEHILHMFYYEGLALPGLPTKEQLVELNVKEKNVIVYFLKEPPTIIDEMQNVEFRSVLK